MLASRAALGITSTTRPCSMTQCRSATVAAKRKFCSTRRMVKPSERRRRMVAPICCTMTGARRASAARPRELGALAAEPLLEIREETEDAVEGKPARADLRGQQEVLLDVEAREDSALLGAEGEAEARDAVRGQGHELVPVEADRALSPRHHAHDGFERGGLAGAVAPEQCHHLPRPHLEADAVQDVRLAIPGVEVPDLEQGALRHGRSPAPIPYRPG